MNFWMVTATVTGACLIPCAWTCLRGSPERRLVGLEMTALVITIVMVLVTVGEGRLIFMDIPLALAVLAFGAGLVFARFLEKHL